MKVALQEQDWSIPDLKLYLYKCTCILGWVNHCKLHNKSTLSCTNRTRGIWAAGTKVGAQAVSAEGTRVKSIWDRRKRVAEQCAELDIHSCPGHGSEEGEGIHHPTKTFTTKLPRKPACIDVPHTWDSFQTDLPLLLWGRIGPWWGFN